MSSPTQRSLKLMRDRGYLCAVTERWNAFKKCRQDLFGFIDVLAIRGDETVAIQTTYESTYASLWASGTRSIVVHGWSKKGPRGKRKTWQCEEISVAAAPAV